jgi:hypothetical protein
MTTPPRRKFPLLLTIVVAVSLSYSSLAFADAVAMFSEIARIQGGAPIELD